MDVDVSFAEIGLQSRFAEVNGIRLHYVVAGEGPLLLLVHGFPQHWYAFRHQLLEFSKDHTVVAVDLRGVNLSGKPANAWEHGVWFSVEDMRALIRHLGFSTCTLVGHDWGGAIGYSLALHYPDVLERLVVLSASHPGTFDRELHENLAQIQAGANWLFLRRKDSASRLMANDFAALRVRFAEHEFFSEQDREIYLAAWRQPGAVQAMVGWYQKEGWGPAEGATPAHGNYVQEVSPLVVKTETLVIYGDADQYILPGNFEGLDTYVSRLTLIKIAGGSHWMLDEHPELINRHIRQFIRGGAPAEVPA